MQRPRLVTVAWLGSLWLANVVLFSLVAHVSVRTITGQMLDTVALSGNSLGRRTVDAALDVALNAVSVVSLVVVLVAIAVVALARQRYSLAIMTAVIVIGSVGTSWLVKTHLLYRPEWDVDPDRVGAGNSLPSGHATAAAAFAIGLTLVLPVAARGVASVLGATYAAFVGIATMSSGWHRPSDVIAAYLLAGAWAAFAGLVLVLVQRRSAVVVRRDRPGWSLATTSAIGAGLTVVGGALLLYVFQRMTEPVEYMANELLRLGYLGSAALITGSAYLMMAVVLMSLHRVVPHSKQAAVLQDPNHFGHQRIDPNASG